MGFVYFRKKKLLLAHGNAPKLVLANHTNQLKNYIEYVVHRQHIFFIQ